MFKSHRGQKHALALCRAAHKSFDLMEIGIGTQEGFDIGFEIWFERLAVGPTIFQNKPFGEHIEGLSYCGVETFVDELKFRKHNTEVLTVFRDIGGWKGPPSG
jgi:hypothetical protein